MKIKMNFNFQIFLALGIHARTDSRIGRRNFDESSQVANRLDQCEGKEVKRNFWYVIGNFDGNKKGNLFLLEKL